MTRYQSNPLAMTSFQTVDGHAYLGDVLPFAETVLFRIPSPWRRGHGRAGKAYRADAQWRKGVWLGKMEDSNEHFLGCDEGVHRVLAVRRLPPSQRGDRAVLESVIGLPWDTRAAAFATTSDRRRTAVHVRVERLLRRRNSAVSVALIVIIVVCAATTAGAARGAAHG